jgi:hypothetical protein
VEEVLKDEGAVVLPIVRRQSLPRHAELCHASLLSSRATLADRVWGGPAVAA